MNKKITLAIETAVGNGSLSLFKNDALLDHWSDETKISRSDRFLPILNEFLERNKIKKAELSLIAVSLGPGSFTGARVGLATALALKNGLRTKCAGISVLQAVVLSMPNILDETSAEFAASAILNDKGEVLCGIYELKNSNMQQVDQFLENKKESISDSDSDNFKLQSFDAFVEEMKIVKQNTYFFLEKNLYKKLDRERGVENLIKLSGGKLQFRDIGENLSAYIGKASIMNYGSDNPKLVYSSGQILKKL